MADETTVEEKIKEIMAKVLRKPDIVITPTTTFQDLKADSLDVVQILVALEDHYDLELMDDDLKDLKNLGEFIAYVTKKAGG